MIEPHLEDAKKACGPRKIKSANHDASREYTRLLVEYYVKGGKLPPLSRRLKVNYSGLRRRVVTHDVSLPDLKVEARVPIKKQDIAGAVIRVRTAKASLDVDYYHNQLKKEYLAGISMARLAKELGLSSAAPLYHGIQRSMHRLVN